MKDKYREPGTIFLHSDGLKYRVLSMNEFNQLCTVQPELIFEIGKDLVILWSSPDEVYERNIRSIPWYGVLITWFAQALIFLLPPPEGLSRWQRLKQYRQDLDQLLYKPPHQQWLARRDRK